MAVQVVLSSIKNQIYATLVANLVIFTFGSNMGWFSPASLTLLSDETPLKTGPLSHHELSWIAAANSAGAIFSTFLVGVLSMRWGSKRATTFLAYPAIAFWILVHFGDTFYHILLARFANGLTGGGFQSGIVLYIAEISNDDIRGRLGSTIPAARNMGMLMGYIVGALISYEYRPYIFISIPIMFLILFHCLPGAPQYYLKRDKFQQAEKAFAFYKGCKGNFDQEKSVLKDEFERMKMAEKERRESSKFEWKDFCNRMAVKGFITSIAMAWLMQTTGNWIITNYASLIFEISGSIFDSNTSAICLAITQIVGGLASTLLGDTFGRKTTLNISLFGSAVALFTFAVHSYLRQNGYDVSGFLWLPVVCLSFCTFISSVGIVAIANTVTVENFSPEIRPVGMVFYSLSINVVALLGEKFFPILLNVIYLHGCLLFLGINCCLGIFFVVFMKETRGKSLDSVNSTDIKQISSA